MHRSGTSMVSQILHQCGLFRNKDEYFLPAHEYDNPHGYWELIDVYRFHEKLLANLGGSWFDLPRVLWEEDWLRKIDIEKYKGEAKSILDQQFDYQTPWGWKDPRNSLFLPFWKELFPELKVIVCLRNPVEVALSIATRLQEYKDFDTGLSLTQDYLSLIEKEYDNDFFMVTHYKSFFYDAHSEIQRICDFIGLNVTKEKIEIASKGIDAQLYRGLLNDEIVNQYRNTNENAFRLYDIFCQRAGNVYYRLENDKTYNNKLNKSISKSIFQLFLNKCEQDFRAYNSQKEISQIYQTKTVELERSIASKNEKISNLEISISSAIQTVESQQRSIESILKVNESQVQDIADLKKEIGLKGRYNPIRKFLKGVFVKGYRGSKSFISRHYHLKKVIKKIARYLFPPRLYNLIREKISNLDSNQAQKINKIETVQSLKNIPSIHNTEPIDESLYSDDYESFKNEIKQLNLKLKSKFKPIAPKLLSSGRAKEKFAESLQFPKQEIPVVSVIIPVYNNLSLTLECLASIQENSSTVNLEIILVNDGSDEFSNQILDNIPNIVCIHNNDRIGYTLSCNEGAKSAKGKFLLFLNNDVQVTPGWLEAMIDIFETRENVGGVGSKIIYPDGYLQEAGALLNIDGTVDMIGHGSNPQWDEYNYVREVDFCSGVCLMVVKDKFWEVGGFDEIYAPAYYEDADLCLKIRNQGLKIYYQPKSEVVHHLSATTAMSSKDIKMEQIVRNRQIFLERWIDTLEELNKIRLIAFYLPQYHPIPENDQWWGAGFTEWTNVAKAKPNYENHYQPHIPKDLGYYDLRLPVIMEQQAELAKRYGITGFCYYYYSFGGKRLLELPLEKMLESGKPDFPFCLCWANENWTRRWDGKENDILIDQKHSDEDDRIVIHDLIRYIKSSNYIRVDGKPIILIYRVTKFPDIKKTARIWREVCYEEGIGEIHLAMVEAFELVDQRFSPADFGMDSSVEFPPHNMARNLIKPKNLINPNYSGYIADYVSSVVSYLERPAPAHTQFHTAMPSWDNTPRLQNNSYIFANASPGNYQAWLEELIKRTREKQFGDKRMIFINAWNEWAEGTHLEPDQKYGHGYLAATQNALNSWLLKKEGN